MSVSAPEGTGTGEADLAEGQELTGLVIHLAGRARLTGRIVALDGGQPMPGFTVYASPIEPDSSSFGVLVEVPPGFEEKGPPVSGANGRFAVEDLPRGPVQIAVMPSRSQEARYTPLLRTAELAAGTTNLGDLRFPPRRLAEGQRAGYLGFYLAEGEIVAVGMIRPDGPAAGSGLHVGDVIVSVDGIDVRDDVESYGALCTVPPGTAVTFGLARGASVRIVAVERTRGS